MANLSNLYSLQKSFWASQNQFYFGLSPRENWDSVEKANEGLKEDADRFYNNGTCEFKKLLEGGKCNDIDKLVPGSWELVFDSKNGCICLYAQFFTERVEPGATAKTEQKRAPIAYFPYPSELGWFIGESEYILRITANINYGLFYKEGDKVKYQKVWVYNTKTGSMDVHIDDFDPYEKMTDINRRYLEAIMGCEITKDNFFEALGKIPQLSPSSILNFKFEHVSEVFRLIATSKRFANPLMHVSIPIDVTKMLTARRISDSEQDDGSFTNMILNTRNQLFALENARTVIFKSMYNISFCFADCDKFFDSFKTSTNKSAGRSRLVLDGVFVKDHMLWNIGDDGEEHDMFHFVLNPDKQIRGSNISSISNSPFSQNNAPKRIMMTCKLRPQAVKTIGETDPFTHDTPARIVFGDFEGFNNGDSIIISRSFAKKLESSYKRKILLEGPAKQMLLSKYHEGDEISLRDLAMISNSNATNNFRHPILLSISGEYATIEAQVPFSVGDKITNLHGSKGIVSIILPDEEMPYLINNLGPNMPAGPLDVIVSAISVYKRKSPGQIFEAWATAMGIDDVVNIPDAISRYSDQMVEYGRRSVIRWHGSETIKPCGINTFLRLDHNAVSKQSFSDVRTNYGRMLKLGEMELLNLAARGLYGILREMDVRSISKHSGSISAIKAMQETGEANVGQADNLRFLNVIRVMGFDTNLRAPSLYSEDDSRNCRSIISDQLINLFEGGWK